MILKISGSIKLSNYRNEKYLIINRIVIRELDKGMLLIISTQLRRDA